MRCWWPAAMWQLTRCDFIASPRWSIRHGPHGLLRPRANAGPWCQREIVKTAVLNDDLP